MIISLLVVFFSCLFRSSYLIANIVITWQCAVVDTGNYSFFSKKKMMCCIQYLLGSLTMTIVTFLDNKRMSIMRISSSPLGRQQLVHEYL